MQPKGKLIAVSVPIGNLGDITERAKQLLLNSNAIACEDSRVTGSLLAKIDNNYQSGSKTFISYRDQNHEKSFPKIFELLSQGADVLLVSDTGTPGISDPGYKAIRAAYEAGIEVEVAPGATAVTAALSLSGLPTDKFVFLGFFPRKKHHGLADISSFLQLETTVIYFESPHRISSTVQAIAEEFPINDIAVIKEITKLHQKTWRGTARRVAENLSKSNTRGEFVIVISKLQIQEKLS